MTGSNGKGDSSQVEVEPKAIKPSAVPPRAGDPEITPEVVADHGLSPDEWERIRRVMGRDTTWTELGVFSAMWSEHCGYKNSKRLLKLLPTSAPWVIQGPGENAGVIDVGDGWALAFKIESHNHPSAVEPYQGAATGVGGILRDVFTMGARPIAVLDSLRFGDLDSGRVRYLFGGVVKGIGDYGNCVGIPNIGGEVFFDRGYEGNPIVNAMCLGLMRKEELIKGEAKGVGNALMAVGARTGRDGIHGATFASDVLSTDSEASRPQVQVGDPFTEKLLLEASLELIKSGHITGIQDMGAAGLTSSASEMAGRAGNGVEIDVAKVPVREQGMTPYEILLSESQERMLVVAETGSEDEVRRILEKWELEAAVIGRVTDDGLFRVLEKGKVVAEIPARPLTDGCPTYERPGTESDEVKALRQRRFPALAEAKGDQSDALLRLLGSPNIGCKRWVHDQYDSTVRTSTALGPGGDAGVIRIRGTRKAVAAKTDCNGRYCYLSPRRGASIAVAEAARNLVCVGAVPTAVTNNLNFGSPLRPEVYFQLREAVDGMAEACRVFETPVTGGNVSLYNETDKGAAIYPTPVIGMVGIVEDVDHITGHAFRAAGDAILLLGKNTDEIGASEYLYTIEGVVAGAPPAVDLEAERLLQQAVLAIIQAGLARSAHDCSEGGFACALAECAMGDGEDVLGVDVELEDALPAVPLLFGEAQGRVILSCAKSDVQEVMRLAERHDVPCAQIGTVTERAQRFRIRTRDAGVDVDLEPLADAWFGALERIMEGEAAAV
jgi:phosphoribosylformylglycinamidine synthase II